MRCLASGWMSVIARAKASPSLMPVPLSEAASQCMLLSTGWQSDWMDLMELLLVFTLP